MDNDFFTSNFETDVDQNQAYNPNMNNNQNIAGDRKVNIWTGRFEDEVPLLEGIIAFIFTV